MVSQEDSIEYWFAEGSGDAEEHYEQDGAYRPLPRDNEKFLSAASPARAHAQYLIGYRFEHAQLARKQLWQLPGIVQYFKEAAPRLQYQTAAA